MLIRWYDVDREVATLNELNRRMQRLFGEGRPAEHGGLAGGWPRVNLYDNGSSLTAMLEVPGLKADDLEVEVHGDVFTVSGERKLNAPEGYRVHRTERGSRRFSRSFGLPCKVDPEKTKASLNSGVLTIEMEKHPEAQPRQITISSNS